MACAVLAALLVLANQLGLFWTGIDYGSGLADVNMASSTPPKPQLDRVLYDRLMNDLANNPVPKVASSSLATSTIDLTASSTDTSASSSTASTTEPHYLWPVKDAPYPEYGALLPFDRVVAYYGNFLSTGMGVLGQYPPDEVITRLMDTVAQWQAADPTVKTVPGIDYIAVAAQGYPGQDGMYRARMPASEIQKAVDMANQVNGVVILDIQPGWSTMEQEIPLLEPFLKLPNVELALDPEFALKPGQPLPSEYIGSIDAVDVNFAAGYLAQLVDQYDLPPKMLVVHRFTEHMVTNYQDIKPLPEVEIVMDMDGWGTRAQKGKVYNQIIYPEPVQFTGIKLFYKNDLAQVGTMMAPEEILSLRPKPSFIQYQ